MARPRHFPGGIRVRGAAINARALQARAANTRERYRRCGRRRDAFGLAKGASERAPSTGAQCLRNHGSIAPSQNEAKLAPT